MTLVSSLKCSEASAIPKSDHSGEADASIDLAAFRAVFDHAPCGMLVANTTGTILSVNTRLCEMFGYTPEALVGQKIEMLLPRRFHAGHVALRENYAAAPSPRVMGGGRDVTGLRKDGMEFPVDIGLTAVDTAAGRISCASIVDITERKRAELKLREANALLEEFTYVASHDLRSPLRGIAHLIDFIREDYGGSVAESAIHNLDRMTERIQSMEKLISDLLAYARAGKRSLKLEPIDLRQMIAEIAELEATSDHVRMAIDVPDETFVGAKTPLATVIRNLVSNAIKHHDRAQINLSVNAWLEGNHCIIEVTDDGPGIPLAAQQRVFRLFQTLNASERKGAGLGLAVVQRLVEGHGGAIMLISAENTRGCTFRVIWPRFARSDLDD